MIESKKLKDNYWSQIINLKNNSLENIETNIDDPFIPAQSLFLENKEINISFSQFKYILENFSNKTINIHTLCNEINVTLPTILRTIEMIRPMLNDRATKIKLIKLSNLLFQSTPQE